MAFSIKSILLRSQTHSFRRKAGAALCITAAGATGFALVTSKDVQQRVRYGSHKRSLKFPETQPKIVGRALADTASGVAVDASDDHRKVVFAFDTTDASQYAFEWALENFFHAEDTVLLLNVRPSNTPPQDIETKMGIPLSERQARLQETERLDRVHYELSEARGKAYEQACRDKGITCQAVHAMGNPAVRIVDVGAENSADCIVLGTHDRGALGRLTFGGVPTYVVHNAHCPVIVARPKKKGPVEHESPFHEHRAKHVRQEELNRKNTSENLWRLARKR